jgi:hypothetical protein
MLEFDMLVAGLAAFVFVVVVEFVVVVFVVVVVLPPLVVVFVVVFVVAVLAGLFVLLVLVLLSGQAVPNKPNVKTAERAITFFISIIFSCLLQRMYIYFIV